MFRNGADMERFVVRVGYVAGQRDRLAGVVEVFLAIEDRIEDADEPVLRIVDRRPERPLVRIVEDVADPCLSGQTPEEGEGVDENQAEYDVARRETRDDSQSAQPRIENEKGKKGTDCADGRRDQQLDEPGEPSDNSEHWVVLPPALLLPPDLNACPYLYVAFRREGKGKGGPVVSRATNVSGRHRCRHRPEKELRNSLREDLANFNLVRKTINPPDANPAK